MSLQLEPDVAFGSTPEFGIAAAVADDRPFLHEVLRKHHFEYNARLDVYLLPPEIPHNTAVHNVAAATREFQAAGLSVAADPRAVVPPEGDGPGPVPSQPQVTLPEEAHELRDTAEIAEVIRSALDDGIGAVGELNDLIDTATTWCNRLDSDEGREMAQRLHHITYLVTSLNDHVMSAVMELEDMSQEAPKNPPARPEAPHHERQEGLPVPHTSRSRAATATPPQRPGPTPKSAFPQPAPPAQSPRPGNRRTR